MAPSVYFESSFGDIPLLVSSISTSRGRDIAIQSPAHGDRHTLTDRGLRNRETRVELLFVEQPGLAPYLDRYDALVHASETGEVAIFSHPLDGSYRARVGSIDVEASNEELSVRASCTFYREDPPQSVFAPGAGVSTTAAPEAVSVAATLLDERLAALGLSSGIGTEAMATVGTWTEATDLDAQQVYLEVATLTDRIDTAIADLELAQDLSRWQAYEAMVRLRYQITRVAEAVTSATSTVFDLYVETPRPIIAICAEIYGAGDAQERGDEVTKLNRIRTPGLVARGTTLKMPAVGR